MVVNVQSALARELIALARVVLTVPFVIVAVAGAVVSAYRVVGELVAVQGKRAEEVLVRSVVGRETRVELSDQIAPRGDAGIKIAAAVGLDVFDLLRVRQVLRLHQEEAYSLVGLKIRRGHGVGIDVHSGRNVGDFLERIPGVLVFSLIVRRGGDVERVGERSASAERENEFVVACLLHFHRRRIVRIDLQELAESGAGTTKFVDARDVAGGKRARPEGEVV